MDIRESQIAEGKMRNLNTKAQRAQRKAEVGRQSAECKRQSADSGRQLAVSGLKPPRTPRGMNEPQMNTDKHRWT